MEPQMIRVKEGLSPTSHLHSEKIRISGDAAIFEIKREIPGDGSKFSSRYEIYNSTTKPFGKSYRELTLSSSTSGSSCESHTSSLSSSGLSETTTYITCSSEIEPVQMTGFQCIDETQEKHLVSIMNAENYDLHEATNYDIGYNSKKNKKKQSSCDEAPIEKHYSTFYKTTTGISTKINHDDDDGDGDDEKPIIKTNTWSSRTTHEPLKSPKLLKQMISNFETERIYEPPIISTKNTYKEDEYTYEPELDTNVSKTVTRCRSMMNLELKQDTKDRAISPIVSKATSELDLQQESKLEEKKRITKTISVMLEKRRKLDPVKPTVSSPPATIPNHHNDKLINDNIILIESTNNTDRSCRVTGEILKNSPQSNFTDYHRTACTLPRAVKSHRSQLQRHFYYPQYVGKGTRVKDEELPDPDKVKSARELFERVLKIGSLENVNKPTPTAPTSPKIIYRPTPEIRQPADIQARQKLQKCLSVDTSHPEQICKWTDNGSLSSGVGSDISAETDIELSPKSSNGIDCGSKEDIIFTSDEDLSTAKDEDLGKPISDDVLRNIRAFGTSVTYYGGKVIATSKGYSRSPMTMTIMNEIKKSSPDFQATRKFLFDDKHFAKFKLIKSNSCGSGLELSGTEEYGKEYDKTVNGIVDGPKVDTIKREPEPIKEEEEEQPQEKQPTAKDRINAIETKTEQRKQFYKNNKNYEKPFVDMEFEEFQVMEEKS
ncbi:uncharacterized protein jv [Planococcus citri]|uniref:uncharacterized protein jv n=1 Tax=Planococcus citri TaxID=170843 RepID=UPI0031FA390E